MTRIHDLNQAGQSIWFDYIDRSLLATGGLKRLVEQGVTGVTSNPSIFEKAITGSADYDDDIAHLASMGFSGEEIYESLARRDIARAADILLPVYMRTGGADGFVSLEVSPKIAFDEEATFEEAARLFASLGHPNVMIKVPATEPGLVAATRLIGAGVNVNLTLIFSVNHYIRAAECYLNGLSMLRDQGPQVPGGLSQDRVASVASVFVSRTDSLLDPVLREKGRPDLAGKMAIATAKVVYAEFGRLFSGPAWDSLAGEGARVQKPLWASTSTKSPDLPDTVYVDELIGPDTVNTLPPNTLLAFLDHGAVAQTLAAGRAEAEAALAGAAALGMDLDFAMDKLQHDGLGAFAKSFSSLVKSISLKREAFLSEKKIA